MTGRRRRLGLRPLRHVLVLASASWPARLLAGAIAATVMALSVFGASSAVAGTPRLAYDGSAYAYDASALLSSQSAAASYVRGSPPGLGGVGWGGVSPSAATGVAANTAVGFADDAVASAYQGMRSGGGHAIRHLRDEGLIANSGSLSSQVAEFEQLTSPILRAPTRAFDWRVGETMTRAFAGEAGGRQVVVFVAKEGPYQGSVLSAVVPDAAQMAQWGLP